MEKGKYIFLEFKGSLSELYTLVVRLINAAKNNPSGILQHRWGDNYGGEYYFIEAIGFEINLIQNKGESFIEEYSHCNYYLFIAPLNEYLLDRLDGFTSIITTLLEAKSIIYKVH